MHKKEYVDILREVVKVNTVNSEKNEKDLVKVILEYFSRFNNIEKKVIDHGGNRASLIIKICGIEKKGGIAFIGHIDTVAIGEVALWKYAPLEGIIHDGHMYGRGTSDMKGGVTAMIATALHILENSIVPRKDVYFCFTADEENGGLGIQTMVSNGDLDSVDEVIICEPTDEKLGIIEKGALWLKINVKGRSSHGSMPESGINAIEMLIEIAEKINKLIPKEIIDDYVGNSTVSITKIIGGIQENMIPECAECVLDIRTLPVVDHEELIEKIQSILDEYILHSKVIDAKVEILNNRHPLEADTTWKIIRRLEKIYANLNMKYEYCGINFYTDASQLIPIKNVPFVILGPGYQSLAHKTNECISLKSVENIIKVYKEYIL